MAGLKLPLPPKPSPLTLLKIEYDVILSSGQPMICTSVPEYQDLALNMAEILRYVNDLQEYAKILEDR